MDKDLYKLADELEDIICNLDLSEHTSSKLYNIANGIRDYQLNEEVEDKKIEKLNIVQEKNCKNNWKWKIKDIEHDYNISTPQKIMCNKINEIIDYINKGE